MDDLDRDWEDRVAALWAALDDYEPQEFCAPIEDFACEQPALAKHLPRYNRSMANYAAELCEGNTPRP